MNVGLFILLIIAINKRVMKKGILSFHIKKIAREIKNSVIKEHSGNRENRPIEVTF